MQTIHGLEALRKQVADWRSAGQTVAFVPTMGNLHRGHLSLVEQAAARASRVLVSIFVNPLQFGPGEDLDAYPRTLDADLEKLGAGPAAAVFVPSVASLYPRGLGQTTRVCVPELGEELCGAHRPGHFDGVTTVVNILCNLVQPDFAVFGKKDFQQLLIIRRMVEDLAMPVRILAGETVRESDGLAMSSRNQYLSTEQRQQAPTLYRVLQQLGERLAAGERAYAELETTGVGELAAHGFQPEYVSIRDSRTLARPTTESAELVVACAARLGRTRLIDNLLVPVLALQQ